VALTKNSKHFLSWFILGLSLTICLNSISLFFSAMLIISCLSPHIILDLLSQKPFCAVNAAQRFWMEHPTKHLYDLRK
jgi:hypothetical protein